METKVFAIRVNYYPAEDGDPAGYVAVNDELGLVIEAGNFEDLKEKVLSAAKDLFELNYLKGRREPVKPLWQMLHQFGDETRGEKLLQTA